MGYRLYGVLGPTGTQSSAREPEVWEGALLSPLLGITLSLLTILSFTLYPPQAQDCRWTSLLPRNH